MDNKVIINTDPNKDHHKHLIRIAEGTLGDLITDAIRSVGKSDVSIISGGSIRTDLLKGNITSLNVLSILPYTNEIVVKEISGKDLLDLLEMAMKQLPDFSPRFVQVSGMSFIVNTSIPSPVVVDENEIFIEVNGTRRVSDVKIGGEELVLDKNYTISLDEYTSKGGDGFSMLAKYEEIRNTQIMNNEALIKYIKEQLNGTISDDYKQTQGRIIIKSDSEKKDDKKRGDNGSSAFIVLVIFILSLLLLMVVIVIFKKRRKTKGETNSINIANFDENLVDE